MSQTIIVTIVALYLVANLVVGLLPARKSSSTVSGYVTADRSFGTLLMYFITGATMFSAFAFLGGPGWAYGRGMAALYIPAYGILGIFPWYFLGQYAARCGRKHAFVTQAGLLGFRFNHRGVTFVAGLAGIIAMIPYVTLQMRGAGIVLETVAGIPLWMGAALAYGVVLIYVWVSGVMGVGWTNAFQGMFMMAIAWFFGIYIPMKLYGGVGDMFQAIADVRPEMLTAPGLTEAGTPWTWGEFSSAVLVSALGVFMWPHLFMKSFAAKDERVIRRTIALYPTFQIFLLPLFLVGFAGILYTSSPATPDAIMPHLMLTSGLPAVVIGLFCAGALAASMSTGDALLHGAASMAVEDVAVVVSRRERSDAEQRTAIRVTAIGIGIIAYVWAIGSSASLVDLLLFAYGIVVQLVPGVYGAFWSRKLTGSGVMWGLVAGIGMTALLVMQPELRLFNLHAGLLGLIVNVVVAYLVSFFTDRPNLHHVENWMALSRGVDEDGRAPVPLAPSVRISGEAIEGADA